MSELIVPVVLAGGLGTRLWPISRVARPKQFLPLIGMNSLYQETLARVKDRTRYAAPIVLTNGDYRFLAAEQALEAGVDIGAILLEPVARNTAAAIVAAAAFAADRFGRECVILVLPSDHALVVDSGYTNAISTAARAAANGNLVTFGITPTAPETGYGYIEVGDVLDGDVRRVARFIEKPDLEGARKLLADGRYCWNSGMFTLGAGAFLDECAALAPDTFTAASGSVEKAKADLDFIRLDEQSFATAPNISVDYAVFEKTRKAAVLPVAFEWSDLGSWDAVWKSSKQDAAHNATIGPVTLSNTTRSFVLSERAHVAVEGLDDIAVIASEDAIYVGKRSEAQKVGTMVKDLKSRAETVALTEIHRTVYRPWGGYTSVLAGERFQVKRLFVKPGKKLSLQKHHHRSEHWIVVRGAAEVTVDGTVTQLGENQSIYLPLGCVHRLANPGKILLELIEVQTGSYLGEDDIIRLDDEFGRA